MRDDESFLAHVTGRLAALPAVRAVALGGSRATGTHRPGSDWDFAVYYRGAFSPADVRALGWPGEVSEIGGWGTARGTLGYARNAHAGRGHLTDCAGAIATAACQAAHAVMAAHGQWVTNEKTLLDRAGLRGIDHLLAGLTPDPPALTAAMDDAETTLARAIAEARRAGASVLDQAADRHGGDMTGGRNGLREGDADIDQR